MCCQYCFSNEHFFQKIRNKGNGQPILFWLQKETFIFRNAQTYEGLISICILNSINFIMFRISFSLALLVISLASTPCEYGCRSCQQLSCLECLPTYYLTNKNCIRCGANCARCNSGTSCLTCDQGYYLKGGQCFDCGVQCRICFSGNIGCVSSPQYTYILAGTSYRCPNVQNGCNNSCSKSLTSCTSCSSGFFSYANSIYSTCIPCQDICKTCLSANSCTSCLDGSYFSNQTCLPCGANCSTCSSIGLCISCHPNYYLSSSKCLSCLQGCSSCSINSTCLSCSIGFWKKGSVCEECIANCINCSSYSTCNNCQSGFYLNDSTCLLCSSNCSTCLNNLTCISCTSGFYLSYELACIQCLPSCQQCINASICTSCKEAFQLLSNKSCSSCPASCDICTSSQKCISCSAGYYLRQQSGNQLCYVCQPNCKTCSNFNTCVKCQENYYLFGTLYSLTCLGCSKYCKTCINFNGCVQCPISMFVNSGNCYSCLQNCQLCVNNSACQNCTKGYDLVNNTCSKISEQTSISEVDSSTNTPNLLIIILIPIVASFLVIFGGFQVYKKCRRQRQEQPIQRLPKPYVDGTQQNIESTKKVSVQQMEKETCPICLDDDPQTSITCKHKYHFKCIQFWIRARNRSCPVCRRRVQDKIIVMCSSCKQEGFAGKLQDIAPGGLLLSLQCINCKIPLNL